MKVTLKQAKEIIASHNDLIGASFQLPGGDEMFIKEFRLLGNPTEKGVEVMYTIIALLQNSDYDSNVQFYTSLESIVAQLKVTSDTGQY